MYLISFESADATSWLALGEDARAIADARTVHEAASLAALVEFVEDLAGVQPEEPRVANNAYLDEVGVRLGSGLASALEQALPAVEALADAVVARHKAPLT